MSRTVQIEVREHGADNKIFSQSCTDDVKSVICAVQAVRTKTNEYLTSLITNHQPRNDNDTEEINVDDVDMDVDESSECENKRRSSEPIGDDESKRPKTSQS